MTGGAGSALLGAGLCAAGARPRGALLPGPGGGGGRRRGPSSRAFGGYSARLLSFNFIFLYFFFPRARSPCPCQGPVWGGIGRVSKRGQRAGGAGVPGCGYPWVRVSREYRCPMGTGVPGVLAVRGIAAPSRERGEKHGGEGKG